MKMQTIKCVVVGDVVGKTCLLTSYTTNKFPSDGVPPTVFENYEAFVPVGGELYTLTLFDTAGSEGYDRFRPMIYPQADVFLVCFSIASPPSFDNARHKWVPEINTHRGSTPFLLVGTKVDLRSNQEVIKELAKLRESPVSKEQGEILGQELKAVKYVECSALTQVGLKNVFDEVVMAVLDAPQKPKKKKGGCVIL